MSQEIYSHPISRPKTLYGVRIIVEDSAGNILLLLEGVNKSRKRKGQISIPAGTVEPGENTQETARREIREEVGLDLNPHIPFEKRGNVVLNVAVQGELIQVLCEVVYTKISEEKPNLTPQKGEILSAWRAKKEAISATWPHLNGQIRPGAREAFTTPVEQVAVVHIPDQSHLPST